MTRCLLASADHTAPRTGSGEGIVFQQIGGLILGIIFMLGQFPGGTILMALRCDSHRLNGWDWVLSVVIPFYGLIKAFTSSAC